MRWINTEYRRSKVLLIIERFGSHYVHGLRPIRLEGTSSVHTWCFVLPSTCSEGDRKTAAGGGVGALHKGMFERVLSKWCCKWIRSQGWILPISGEVPGRARDTYVLQIHCRCNDGPQPVIQELYMQNAAPMFSHGSFVPFWGWGQPIAVLWLHGIRQHLRVSGSRLQSRCCQNKSARRLHLIPPVPLCLRHISVFVGRNITACLCAHFLNCIKRMTHSATLFKLTLIASEWCAWEAGADGTMRTCN